MKWEENIPLRPYNTFHLDASAAHFARFSSVEELQAALKETPSIKNEAPGKLFILGGGSNIVLRKNFNGFVLKNEIRGIQLMHEDNEHVYVKAGAGENWHQFVLYCIERGWCGVENLSLIPGTMGAAPMQNIGAYGVELVDVFWALEAFDLRERKMVNFTKADCAFGYRESVFKNKYKGQFVITCVTLQLRKKPIFHTKYGAVEQELEKMGVTELSIKAISDAVIRIRSSKLPDPALIGNAGSFFKNPEVSADKFQALKKSFPEIVGYPLTTGKVKLAAGWMIEHCGPGEGISWKGYREGDAGVHEKQALVLVNYGNAKGDEIYALSEKIIASVNRKYGVKLEREVNVV